MTRSHAVSSFKSRIFDKSSQMSSRISPLLNKKPNGFFFSFFLKRLIWGMNSSKYIIRLWHVRRLQLFSVINPVFYWHATGMLEGISSALNGSSIFCFFFLINFQCNLWQNLRMRIWRVGSISLNQDLLSLTDRWYQLFPWWVVSYIFEARGPS